MKEENSRTISNVSAERVDQDTFEISWETVDKELNIAIYVGESADTIDRVSPVARVSGETAVRIKGLDSHTRYYFEVVPDGEAGVVTSERRVALEGAVNFRDLGGYETSDGRRVRWGQVFRSDSLGRLTARDQTVLSGMGLRVVCDFRTPSEVENAPDRLPEGGVIEYLHLPIVHGAFDSVRALERMKKGDISWLSKDFMIKGYIRNIEEFGETWGTVLRRIIESKNRPLLFHCTGGKDRAGVCAALFLLALGVPEDTVIHDHGLTNVYIAGLLEMVHERIREIGIEPDHVAPYFTASREYMVSVLDHIGEVYGSSANYLKTKAGIDDERLALLRQELLE